MAAHYDFIAIGDTVTDAFIDLKENEGSHIDIDKGSRELCMRFADKIPYQEVYVVPAVGNSANAAVAAARLGLKSALVSNIGGDYFGQECLAALKTENVSAEFVTVHKDRKTNYHYVLWYEDDRTILIKHEQYPYSLPDINDPKWVYFSSLSGNSEKFHGIVLTYLEKHPKIKLAFQPGTFQMKMGRHKLAGFYKRAEVFICNKEESQRILEIDENDIKTLLQKIHELGPRITVITDGPKGAYAFDSGGPSTGSGQNSRGEFWFMPPYPDPKPPYERTGAGDAFSSTFVVALCCLGSDRIEDALRWAPINSMSVVQYVGARQGLLTREKLEEYLANAPKDYKPRSL